MTYELRRESTLGELLATAADLKEVVAKLDDLQGPIYVRGTGPSKYIVTQGGVVVETLPRLDMAISFAISRGGDVYALL